MRGGVFGEGFKEGKEFKGCLSGWQNFQIWCGRVGLVVVFLWLAKARRRKGFFLYVFVNMLIL